MYRSPFFLKMALLLPPPLPWSFPRPPSCGGLETLLRRERPSASPKGEVRRLFLFDYSSSTPD